MTLQKLTAEALGTALLLISIVGSGIMGANLTDDVALALLVNTIATGCMLFLIITILGPISGAHFNPVVTLAFALRREHPWRLAALYIPVQVIGGILGVLLCHVMFDLETLQFATKLRSSTGLFVSEIFGTFGLLFVIFGGIYSKPDAVPALVGLYITGAYWFASSSSFANPAVTIARAFTDTFTGIEPSHVWAYLLAQVIGLAVALPVLRMLFGPTVDRNANRDH